MYYYTILFCLLCMSYQLSGQNMDQSIEEKINSISKEWYEKYSGYFEENDFLYDKEKNYQAPWQKYNNVSKQEIEDYAELLTDNFSVKFEKRFSKEILVLNFEYPENEKTNELMKLLEHPELILKNGVKLTSNDLNWSTGQECKKINQKKCTKINAGFYDIQNAVDLNEVMFNLKILCSYNFRRIEKNSENDSLKIGDYNFKVIDIVQNKVVILFKNSKCEEIPNLNHLNLDDQHNLIKQLNPQRFTELTKRPSDNRKILGVNSVTKIDSYNYKIFKENTGISYLKYKDLIKKKLLIVLNSSDQETTFNDEFGQIYTVFSSPSKIDYFYLYQPIYLNKKFELQIK